VVISLFWLNFVALWLRVYQITTISDVTDSIHYLGGLIAAYGVVVCCWVVHNVRLYRTKNTRSARVVDFMDTHDTLRRYISRKVDLHYEQEILVNVVGDRKVFAQGLSAQEKEAVPTGVR
jgi:hypothetical protein